MNRLQSEWLRLYDAAAAPATPQPDARRPVHSPVRAAVLALARPADWDAMSRVWRGVQMDWGLPAPAIAVNGADGYQLWFSLAEPVPAAQAFAFVDGLRSRYLVDIAAQRLGMAPGLDVATLQSGLDLASPPPSPRQGERWSAFVAPDLAPVFADEPWLDIAPSLEGQADLLCRLESIPITDFQAVLRQLQARAMPTSAPAASETSDTEAAGPGLDPQSFLLKVMNDASVAMALRIEAAKALLPSFDKDGRR